MDPAWIAVLGTLGGVVVGSGAEMLRARSTFRREKKWSLWDDQKRHLEMVYEALEQLRESYGLGVAHTTYGVRQGKMSGFDSPKAPWARLRMLVHLYTPSLIPDLEKVRAARSWHIPTLCARQGAHTISYR